MARYERHPWTASSDARAMRAVGRWAEGQGIAPPRGAPQSPKAQARWLRDEVYHGNTREMARAYGVSQRTVQRWITKGGERRRPRGTAAERVTREVSETRQRRTARRARLAAARGAPPRLRAKGWIGPAGGTARGRARDTPTTRLREMPPLDLDPDQAAALAMASERNDPDAIRAVLADRYEDYFARGAQAGAPRSASGRWVAGADVGELDWIELE